MLNYIWGGLIIVSLLFALFIDVREIATDRFRNEQALDARVEFPRGGYRSDARSQPIRVLIDSVTYNQFYGTSGVAPDSSYSGTLVQNEDGTQIHGAAASSRAVERAPSPGSSLPRGRAQRATSPTRTRR